MEQNCIADHCDDYDNDDDADDDDDDGDDDDDDDYGLPASYS